MRKEKAAETKRQKRETGFQGLEVRVQKNRLG